MPLLRHASAPVALLAASLLALPCAAALPLAALLLPAPALAAPAGDDRGAEPFLLFLEAGAESLGPAGYLLAEPGIEYRGQTLHLAVGAPLRLSVVPGEPGAGALRREDFDERSDFGAILRALTLGEEGEPFRLVAGSVPPATLGHGAVVSEHRGGLDPDHGRAGARLVLDAGLVALDVLATDVLSPRLFAGRLALPVGQWVGLGDRLSLGAGYAVDPEGRVGPAEGLTPARVPIAATTPVQLASVDLDVVLIRHKRFVLAPYADGVVLVGGGAGLHAGSAVDVRLGSGAETILGLRAEYRRLGAGYLPGYFDPFYEVERHAYPTARSPPKRDFARRSPEGDGLAAEARFSREGKLSLTARVEGRGHGPIAAQLGADVRVFEGTCVGALVARRGAVTPLDLLDLSGESWLLAEARSALGSNLYLFSTAAQAYHLGDDGLPAPLVEVSFGLGGVTGF